MVYLLSFILLFCFMGSFRYLHVYSYLVVPWVIVFTMLWSLPVFVFWYTHGDSQFLYAFKNFSEVALPEQGADELIFHTFWLLLASALMFVGSMFALKVRVKSYSVEFGASSSLLFLTPVVWGCCVVYIYLNNGLPWYYIFFPVYADSNIYLNYIFRGVYLYSPFLAVYYAFVRRSSAVLLCAFFLWGGLVAFSTGQRRDFLSFILFFSYVFSYFKYGRFSISDFLSLFKSYMFFICALSGVVVLWILRVFFTNLIRDGEVVNPLEVRGVYEILYGSGASGAPAYFTVNNWISENGSSFFYSLYYGVSQLVPRGFWPEKFIGIDSIIQNGYSLKDSPSIFWFGDLAFSFGTYFYPFAGFFIGFLLTLLQKKLILRRTSSSVFISAFLFCNVFAFYKNGLGTYISVVLTGCAIIFVLWASIELPCKLLRQAVRKNF